MPVIAILILILYSTKNSGNFVMIPEIIIATCGSAIGIISLNRREIGISSNIGVGFLVLSIFAYTRGIMVAINPNSYDTVAYNTLTASTVLLEVAILPISCFLYKFKIGGLKALASFIVIEVLVFSLGIVCRIPINNYSDVVNLKMIWIGLVFLLSAVAIFALLKIDNKCKKINIIPNVLGYLILINIYSTLNNIFTFESFDIKFILNLIRDLAYFILYEAVSRRLLEENYRREEEELRSNKEMYENLNKKLAKRNTILKELKALNKREDQRYLDIVSSLNDGVIIYHLDKMIYVNESAKGLLAKNFDIKDDEFNINYILDNLVKYIKKDRDKFVVESNDGKKEFEVYKINMGVNDTIIYFKDISDINRYYEIKKEYNKCIKMEGIKNEFYSNVSHELRTPINVIHSALQLNELYIKEDNLMKIGGNTSKIKQNCLRLIRTINNFIDANKISEGYLNPNIKNCNIVEVIENIATVSNKYVEKINNILIFDTSDEEIIVPIDKEMIERVVLNLLSNSVKYGERDKEIKIVVLKDDENKYVQVSVENNNTIIEADIAPYIFEEFRKADMDYTRCKEGSGLGLYLSKAIIEAHEGSIKFTPKDSSNIFSFSIPMKNIDNYSYQEDLELNLLEEKVDVEFSDIYI